MGEKNVRIRRENVEPLLQDLIKQAEYINSHSDKKEFPYTIKNLWVYGSYLNSDKTYLGDIDIFYDFESRWDDNIVMSNYFVKKNKPTTLSNHIMDRLFYPDLLTLKFLRNKHKAFSFMDINEKK
jgi:predicted nucleotidyltransferase